MSFISLVNVNKRYGNLEAIPNLNLNIDKGEFCALVGPSGCGKSTLLRTIIGLEQLTHGHIYIDGNDVTNLGPGERELAMVFQNYALYPHMTVRDNIGYPLKLARKNKKQIIKSVETVSKTLGLEDLLDRKPAALSGGQRQRVAIGRAIIRQPHAFLFDEPLSNLDAELRSKMRLELAELHQRLGITTIYVTHDQIEAMTLADRIVVLRDGMIVQQGSPLELYDNPDNLFVAKFIGSPAMNFFSIEKYNHQVTLPQLNNLVLDLHINDDKELVLGVRPEHIKVVEHGGAKMKIATLEQLGNNAFAYFNLNQEERLCVALGNQRHLRPGDVVNLEIDSSKAFIFNAQNEERLH